MYEILLVGKIVVLTIGLVITYHAYDGYRRHRHSSMLYLAGGFGAISIGTILEGVLFEFTAAGIFTAGAVQTTVSAIGMGLILYSLFGRYSVTIDR